MAAGNRQARRGDAAPAAALPGWGIKGTGSLFCRDCMRCDIITYGIGKTEFVKSKGPGVVSWLRFGVIFVFYFSRSGVAKSSAIAVGRRRTFSPSRSQIYRRLSLSRRP